MWCVLARFHQVEDHKNRTSKYVRHVPTLCVGDLEFPIKVKDILNFEKMNTLNINVFELINTILSPIYNNKNDLQPQVDLLLY